MSANYRLTPQNQQRLLDERNIWLASTRDGGRPHLVPVWFVWHQDQLFICIRSISVKADNMRRQPLVSLALEDGSQVLICEGQATLAPLPWPGQIRDLFQEKYDWDIVTDRDYDQLWAIAPRKWLAWGDD